MYGCNQALLANAAQAKLLRPPRAVELAVARRHMTNATRRLMAQGDRLIEYAPTGATRNAHAAQRAAVVKGPALHRARGAQLMTNRWTWGCPRHRVAFLGGGQGGRQGVGVVDLPGYVRDRSVSGSRSGARTVAVRRVVRTVAAELRGEIEASAKTSLSPRGAPLSTDSVIGRVVTAAGGRFAAGHVGELTRIVPLRDGRRRRSPRPAPTQRRIRDLPSRVVVYLLLAAGLFTDLGYPQVWTH